MTMEHPALGMSFDEYLDERGMREEVDEGAVKAIFARQLEAEMKRKRISKRRLAQDLGTSRSQLDRILDPEYDNVTLGALKRAADVVGLRLRIELTPQDRAPA